jgi:hypothetical protein
MPADFFVPARFGKVPLWASRISTRNGRTLAINSPTTGDEHDVQDRGLELRVVSCTLLFDDMDGVVTTPKQRFDEFTAIVEGGEPQIFTHPLRGSYRATVQRFDHELVDGVISAEVEFVPVAVIPAVTVANAGTTAVAGEGAVTAAADRAAAELAAVSLESQAIDEARAAALSWVDADRPARLVAVDVGRVSSYIGDEIIRLRLDRSIKLWPAHVAMVLLSDSVLTAGRAATADVPRVMTVRIERRCALRTLLAAIYGGFEVDLRFDQAMSLNDITTPGWLEPNTELRLPMPSVQPRYG